MKIIHEQKFVESHVVKNPIVALKQNSTPMYASLRQLRTMKHRCWRTHNVRQDFKSINAGNEDVQNRIQNSRFLGKDVIKYFFIMKTTTIVVGFFL